MAAEAAGGQHDVAMPAAVAVEMIHAYSLIHDDLPAMDDDELRRGRPTVHVAFDEATAILAGDALQAEAFGVLARSIDEPHIAAEALRILADASGSGALVGGQADDLAAEVGGARTVEHLESIHRRKTGALISAAVDLGGLLAAAPNSTRRILADYAKDLGLAFQVVDDLLDFTADETVLGKRAGKDEDRGKLTYPGLLGLEGARHKAEKLVQSARRHASLLGHSAWRLDGLAEYVLERSH
jgi:geranylgeranyl diphosphate synthase type II